MSFRSFCLLVFVSLFTFRFYFELYFFPSNFYLCLSLRLLFVSTYNCVFPSLLSTCVCHCVYFCFCLLCTVFSRLLSFCVYFILCLFPLTFYLYLSLCLLFFVSTLNCLFSLLPFNCVCLCIYFFVSTLNCFLSLLIFTCVCLCVYFLCLLTTASFPSHWLLVFVSAFTFQFYFELYLFPSNF